MIHCNLTLHEVDDLIPHIASAFQTDFKNNFGEYSLEIPKAKGRGKIWGINFPNGIGLHVFKCMFKEDVSFHFEKESISSLRFIYCIEGSIDHFFEDKKDNIRIKELEHLISAPIYNECENYVFKANQETLFCYLEINREKFQAQLNYDLSKIDNTFYEIFADVNNLNLVRVKGFYSLDIANIINSIIENRETGLLRTNFLGAKALDILTAMLRLYKEDVNGTHKNVLRKQDLKAIKKAITLIKNDVANIGSIPEIANQVGIDSHKLQLGFKSQYGMTVNQYIKDFRLQRALVILTSENKNVSEVVYDLGLSNRSYFSKIFKEKYGIAPSQLVKRNNK